MITRVALATVVATAAMLAPTTAPSATAAEEGPWLSAVAPGSSADMTFNAFSDDGVRMFASASADPLTDQAPFGVWDVGTYTFDRLTPSNASSMFLKAAADGSGFVFWTSVALLPEDVDVYPDLYLERGGEITLISREFDGGYAVVTWVGPGSDRVMFRSSLAIVPEDTDTDEDVYMWERATGTIRIFRVDGHAVSPVAMSDDGSRIVVQTPGADLYDWDDGETTFLANGYPDRLSADGSELYLSTTDQLVPADTDQSYDAYVIGPGGATLLSPDQTGSIDLVAISTDGDRWILSSDAPLLPADDDSSQDVYLATADGLTLLPSGDEHSWVSATSDDLSVVIVWTTSRVIPADTDQGVDLYRWDIADPSAITLLTSGSDGRQPTLGGLSSDGRRVIIWTQEVLVPEGPEIGVAPDVYEWSDGVTINLAPGADRGVGLAGVSRDARRVAFSTSSNLVPEDRTTGGDLYLSDRAIQPPSEPIRDVKPPTGTASISGGATYTTTAAVTIDLAATDERGSVTGVRLSNDGSATQFLRPYTASLAWTLSPGDGLKTVTLRWVDSMNNISDPLTLTITVDTTPPSVTSPTRSLLAGTSIIGGAIRVRLAWKGSDAASRIDHYEVQQRTDDGPWTALTTQAAVTLDLRLRPEHRYAFRIRAVDVVGLVGSWTNSPSSRLSRLSETNGRITYRGRWTRANNQSHWGGGARFASTSGSTASLRFTGRSIAWVARTGPTRGKATIYVDGIRAKTIDLYTLTADFQQVVFAKTWTIAKARTLTIRVSGSAGRPRVDLDALVVAE